MNERTKQLWEESQQWNGSDDGRGGLKILESVEKFAELIVRECVDTYDHWATHSMDKNAFVVAKTHVKEHFGFKE